jgi:hypothetical protein
MIRLIASILIAAFFILRDYLCQRYFPEMKTLKGDWDGSNSLTMNTYAVVLFLAFSTVFFQVKYSITYLFQFVVIWFSFADLVFRSFNLPVYTVFDTKIINPICVFLSIVTFAVYTNYKKKPE